MFFRTFEGKFDKQLKIRGKGSEEISENSYWKNSEKIHLDK